MLCYTYYTGTQKHPSNKMKAQILKKETIVEHKGTLLIGKILMYSGRNLFDFYEVEWIDGSKSFIARHQITKTKLKKVGS